MTTAIALVSLPIFSVAALWFTSWAERKITAQDARRAR